MKKILFILFFIIFFNSLVFAYEDDYKKYLDKAWKARQAKDYDEALYNYAQAVNLDKYRKDAYIGILWTYIENGNFEKAERFANYCSTEFRNDIWALKGAAYVYYILKKYDKAIDCYKTILNNFPNVDDYEMRMGLALSYFYGGYKDEFQYQYDLLKLYSQFEKDPRRNLFKKNYQKKDWYIKPQIYFSKADYDIGSTLENDIISNYIIEFINANGTGLLINGTSLDSEYINGEKYTKDIYGVALYYTKYPYFYWVHFNTIDNGEETHKVITLHTLYNKSKTFSVGFTFNSGDFGAITTKQYSPILGINYNKLSLKLKPLLQSSKYDRITTNRFSFAVDSKLYLNKVTLAGSMFSGSRWYLIDSLGLAVWDVDLMIDSGMSVSATLFPYNKFSFFLGYSTTHVEKEDGYSVDYNVASTSFGIIYTF